ncbi:LytR/AlgR family response regulator transcription factor [Flavihumibacter solisilvae]|uniref:HTH LytTR-type domain-containing protein n=1 Tax=Flavihumibacter solisilvae TaxID=1349421 RepID=A0A0C1IVZ6_9BACT|nr:LytTR family DNA-binding domain-containing protein [Flavihumibacter solisilvae]KIC94649.1 hypothetical protein OI18_11220 [Flavihumibacter solisilvae]
MKSTLLNEEHVFFNVENRIVRVSIADIIFIECNHPRLLIITTDDVWTVRMSLDHLQRELPAERFVRVNRSFLVAIAHISYYHNGVVHMGDFEIPVQYGWVGLFKSKLNIINSIQRVAPKKINNDS